MFSVIFYFIFHFIHFFLLWCTSLQPPSISFNPIFTRKIIEKGKKNKREAEKVSVFAAFPKTNLYFGKKPILISFFCNSHFFFYISLFSNISPSSVSTGRRVQGGGISETSLHMSVHDRVSQSKTSSSPTPCHGSLFQSNWLHLIFSWLPYNRIEAHSPRLHPIFVYFPTKNMYSRSSDEKYFSF